jgi:heat-inducible transcriptional repressor
MTSPDPLTPRQRRMLELVVRDHVESAQPVASGGLVRQHHLPYSSATVRHELGQLEDLGYLSQPHTSAGRVPTVAGYRYFVEHLMQRAELPAAERDTIRHQFHQAGWDLERWLKLSAAVLARASGVAALATAEPRQSAPLRRVDLLCMDDGLVQLVAILGNGAVRQLRWMPEAEVDQARLDQLMPRVNARLADAAEPDGTWEPGGLEAEVLAAVARLGQATEQQGGAQLYHAGLSQILEQPEFADGGRLREVVELLEYGQGLEPILGRLPEGGVQVIIGGEPPLERLPYMSLILAPFGHPTARGVLGVVGPTRLAYDRAVPSVVFISRLMTRLMAGAPA